MLEQQGAKQAATFLTAHGAEFALVCRVLGDLAPIDLPPRQVMQRNLK